jgi:hypothetical protein
MPKSSLLQESYMPPSDIMQEYGELKKKARMAFEEIQTTGEYMESHYFKQRSYAEASGKVAFSAFWLDYAEYLLQRGDGRKDFLSSNFTRNAENPTSAILTFALLDLPIDEAGSHGYKPSEVGRGMELTAAGNVILFKKEVREAPLEITNDILVTHRYVPVQGRAGEGEQQAIPDEFLVNRAYTCEVIVTNVSPVTKNFSILYQIPEGSLPLNMTKYMKSVQQSLSPYTTNKLQYHFYFPKAGERLNHFASNVAAEEKIIARASGSH